MRPHGILPARPTELRRLAAGFLVIVLALSIHAWATSANLEGNDFIASRPGTLAATIHLNLLQFLPAFVIFLLADRIQGHPRLRVTVLVLAPVAGLVVAQPVTCYASPDLVPAWCVDFPSWLAVRRWFFRVYVPNLALCAFVMAVVLGRRRTQRTREALHALQAAMLHARRERLELEAQAMQARIDPDLLMDTLERIRQAYRVGLREGERLMDALIAYLQLVVPGEAGERTTLGRQVEQLRAWMALAGDAERGSRLPRTLPEELRDATLPPMLLTSLAAPLARIAQGPLELATQVESGRLRLELSVPGSSRESAEAEDALRERLVEFYGERAHLGIEVRSGIMRATLEVPHESA